MSLTQLQDQIEESFGHGPAHPPVEHRIAAGRRALLRRRIGSAVAGLAVVAAVGTGWYAVSPSDAVGRGTGHVAVDPTPPEPDWEDDVPVRYLAGRLEIRPGVTVHERIDNPYDYELPRYSVALDVTWRGERQWLLLTATAKGYGFSTTQPSNGWAGFADYVSDQVDGTTGGDDGWPETFELDADGDVVPTDGTTVHNRTDDPRLGDAFAAPGTPTGAAVVTVEGDEKSYFVVWRVLDGELDVITTPPADVVGATFEELLTYARAQYAGGEGLR